MKKFFILAVTAIGLAACGGNTKEAPETVAVDTLTSEMSAQLDELAAKVQEGDTAAILELSKQAGEYVDELIAAGDSAAAELYSSKIKEFVEDNKAKLEELNVTSTLGEIVDAVVALPGEAEKTAEEAVEAVKSDAEAAVEAGKEKAAEAVDAAKAEAEQKVDAAKAKAAEKTNEVIDAGAKKVEKAAQDVAGKAADLLKRNK